MKKDIKVGDQVIVHANHIWFMSEIVAVIPNAEKPYVFQAIGYNPRNSKFKTDSAEEVDVLPSNVVEAFLKKEKYRTLFLQADAEFDNLKCEYIAKLKGYSK